MPRSLRDNSLLWLKACTRKLVYQLSRLLPRNPNKAVFGSYKELFSDNSKYLYKHWQQQFIRCIWISANRDVIKQLNGNKQEAYYRWSLLGIYHALTAKYYFYNSYIGDINQWLAGGATKINLWHGSPMKKIEFDIDNGPMAAVFNPQGVLAQFKQSMLAHQQHVKPDLMLSPSPLVDSLFSSAFKLEASQLLRCGNPRTDYYRTETNEQRASQQTQAHSTELAALRQQIQNRQYQQVILYAPSWRDSYQGDNPYRSAFDWAALSKHLLLHNQLFLLRLHPNEAALAQQFSDFANIINISAMEDVYGLLDSVDLLITDYSSLFIDVLPLNIPVSFYRFDNKHYQQNCRNMYDYVSSMAEIGPESLTFKELLIQLQPESINALASQYQQSYLTVKKMYWGESPASSFKALESWIKTRD